MSLLAITHYFDVLRNSGSKDLADFKHRVQDIVKEKLSGSKFTKENIQGFIEELLTGNDKLQKNINTGIVVQQLERSLEGVAPGDKEDIFMKCWNYWLREQPTKTTALMIVDVQNDFISGSLALKHCPAEEDGYDVVTAINEILDQKLFDHIIYTLDWHPPNHCSFIDNVHMYTLHESSTVAAKEAKMFDTVMYSEPIIIEQKLWPVHCVQGTWGAELHEELKAPCAEDFVSKKGFESNIDSYSAFWSSGHFHQTDVFQELLSRQVTDVYTCGLAIDICAKYTARDAAYLGFNTCVVEDACRGTCPHGRNRAKDVFKSDGIHLLDSKDLADHIRKQATSS